MPRLLWPTVGAVSRSAVHLHAPSRRRGRAAAGEARTAAHTFVAWRSTGVEAGSRASGTDFASGSGKRPTTFSTRRLNTALALARGSTERRYGAGDVAGERRAG